MFMNAKSMLLNKLIYLERKAHIHLYAHRECFVSKYSVYSPRRQFNICFFEPNKVLLFSSSCVALLY